MNSKNSDTIYEPEEDSYLLATQVKKYSKGNVLDMGTGSGIQGNTAKENRNVTSVTYADINPATKNIIKDVTITDLFKKIKGKFDTIIFNPPYLPDDSLDDEKLITTGGKNGYEIIERFLKDAKNHLTEDNKNSMILMVFSSLTDKKKVDDIIKDLGYQKFLLAKQNLFMERLYVYMIKPKISENIIKGHRGIVEIKEVKLKEKNMKIAIKKPLNEYYDGNSEAKFLKILNAQNIGPKLITYDANKNHLSMEYIEGERIIEYLSNPENSREDIIDIIIKILKQLHTMDKLRINKLELTNPYKHIIIRKIDHEPVMIDFERCIYTEKPKNITQFIQFLCSEKISHTLKEKSVNIDKKKLLALAREYKKGYDERCFEEISRLF